jgi:hypothetical protein
MYCLSVYFFLSYFWYILGTDYCYVMVMYRETCAYISTEFKGLSIVMCPRNKHFSDRQSKCTFMTMYPTS